MKNDAPTIKRALPEDIGKEMARNRKLRAAIARDSHFMFFHFYFAHYVKHPTSDMHRDMFHLSEDMSIRNLFIVAFRGSAKSSIFTMSYPIWAILGKQQKKFVLILCQTQAQAKQHMMNMRRELESNALLMNDLGPFQEEKNEWGSSSLVFANMNARITAVSTEQSIRGLRHNQNRPDLIIGDDLEDLASTKTRESRNKTYEWVTGEVIPGGDRDTRLVIVGNLLHEDSLMMRLKENVEEERMDGVFRMYPLIDSSERVVWPGKYPDAESIEAEKRKASNEFAWQREFLLRIVPDDEQAIYLEWIRYYDELPEIPARLNGGAFAGVRIGVDPAISKSDSAAYTAMVPALLSGKGKDIKIYILPQLVNKKMHFPETVEECKLLDLLHTLSNGRRPAFVIEDVNYQRALPQHLEEEGVKDIILFRPGTQDKRTRLVLTSNYIKEGKVLFPRKGAELLIGQITRFGVEKNKDLADAFSMLVLSVMETPPRGYGLLFA